jgi:transportin-3
MATNGAQEAFAPDDVLAAVMTMRGGEQESKKKAHEYLERFQKSKGSWGTIFGILQAEAAPEATLFAAITLRGKVRRSSYAAGGPWITHNLDVDYLRCFDTSARG